MADTAAHLIDRVLPEVPVPQWVLTLPYPLRYRCAWDARRGAQQLLALFTRIDMPGEVFQHRTFTRLKQLTHLIRTGQIDEAFFWTEL